MPVFARKRSSAGWYLEGYVDESKTWIIDLKPLPFMIGREPSCQLRLSSSAVSRRHAEIYGRDGKLWIREFGSKNGTFVNRQRLTGEQMLQNGDILHFGHLEFRIHHEKALLTDIANANTLTNLPGQELPHGFVRCGPQFDELLQRLSVIPHFQPIVQLSAQQIVAYELLGRGGAADLPTSPLPLLDIARRLRKEVELSELFRRIGVQQACRLGMQLPLFVNTVPAELHPERLQRSLQALRLQTPFLSIVLEIHETTMTDLKRMQELRIILNDLNIQLAYDDFGAGQARLLELMTVPPDYLKFDRVLIRNLHHQSQRAQGVLRSLVDMARNLGIQTLAEGIEDQEELEACRQIGFDLGQGFCLGRPAPGLEQPLTVQGVL